MPLPEFLTNSLLGQNLTFFLLSSALLAVAQMAWRRAEPIPAQPLLHEPLFKVWMVVIWVGGIFIPLGLIVLGWVQGEGLAARALGPYLIMIAVQVAMEMLFWFGFRRSPVWGLVPCFYLPWRLCQLGVGLGLPGVAEEPLLQATLIGCFALWVINIGVHYSGIPAIFGWRNRTQPA